MAIHLLADDLGARTTGQRFGVDGGKKRVSLSRPATIDGTGFGIAIVLADGGTRTHLEAELLSRTECRWHGLVSKLVDGEGLINGWVGVQPGMLDKIRRGDSGIAEKL